MATLISTTADQRFSTLHYTPGMSLQDVEAHFSDINITSLTEAQKALGIQPTVQYMAYYDAEGNKTDAENAVIYTMVLYKNDVYDGIAIQK